MQQSNRSAAANLVNQRLDVGGIDVGRTLAEQSKNDCAISGVSSTG